MNCFCVLLFGVPFCDVSLFYSYSVPFGAPQKIAKYGKCCYFCISPFNKDASRKSKMVGVEMYMLMLHNNAVAIRVA
jgi:hypothetical protein